MPLIGLINASITSRVASYKEFTPSKFDIKYWWTKPGVEVDFILARGNIAVEARISQPIKKRDIKDLIKFSKEYIPKRSIVVSLELKRRIRIIDTVQIEILPIEGFLTDLWKNKRIGKSE